MTNGFTKKEFKAMRTPGLANRMEAIQTDIQPKFKALGEELTGFLSDALNTEMHLHIARHARRSVNPPDSTWLAICADKRGYKKHPHFQVGLYGDYVFIWLAFIYENEDRDQIASRFLAHQAMFEALPDGFSLSKDHTVSTTFALNKKELKSALERFRDVKKGEFLVGKIYSENSAVLRSEKAFIEEAEDVLRALIPLYKLALK
ncbi:MULTISPECIES: YktB family protein [Listeria]|uniref:YktB family protein n=1 Tax=Listeria TaxID=1637 RepID=UPI000B58ACA1|nr:MULTISPECIES: DUF1054 domain-containing protein [Listeria]